MNKTEHDKLKELEWMLSETLALSDSDKDDYVPPYGDVTDFNTQRLIIDSVGKETLRLIGENSIDLLGTSVAIYETNGDYAFGMFASGWCRMMDAASRELCNTDDNRIALSCGKWLCAMKIAGMTLQNVAIETGKSTDIECVGGIHLYAEPIFANQEVVGVINIGYGDPPQDSDQLEVLADLFGVETEKLRTLAANYKTRPKFIVDVAKKLLGSLARLIGEIIEKADAQKKLSELIKRNEALLHHSPVCHKIVDLDFNLQYMSPSGYKMLKINDIKEVYGNPYPFTFFPSTFKNEMIRNLNKVRETGDEIIMEELAQDTEGNEVWLESALIPVFDENSELQYITVVSAIRLCVMNTTRKKKTWVCTCLRHIYILWFGFRPRACLIIDLMGTGSTAAAC